jgi:hypothetical protein
MYFALLSGRKVVRVALCAASLCAAPAFAGEIYKCVAKDGTPLYQNFPCDIDSLGFLPSNGKPQQTPSPAAPSPAKPTVQPAVAPAPVNVAATATRTDLGLPRVGMTTEEAKALWGEPDEVWEDEPGDGPRITNWRYADGRAVQFDHRHRVLGVQH